jgi:regulator of replication initiation timing
MPIEADFYTPGEVAKMLGLAELTVLSLLTSGQLEGHQDERARWWIPPAAVDAARRSSSAGDSVGPLDEETIPITPVTPTNSGALPASEETTQLEAGEPAQRTSSRENGGQSTGESGWTTTDQAARALGVSPRTVRRLIDRDELEGRKVTEGIVEAWEVSIDSLYALRDKRISEGQFRRNVPRKSVESQSSTDNTTDYVRELTDRLLRISSEAAELRTRLELTFKAESTLQEERDRLRQDWERERQERQEAQEEAQRLREELVAERSKGFWQRLFGS